MKATKLVRRTSGSSNHNHLLFFTLFISTLTYSCTSIEVSVVGVPIYTEQDKKDPKSEPQNKPATIDSSKQEPPKGLTNSGKME